MIFESVVTSINSADELHIAPMGITREGGLTLIAPFKPSSTLDNLSQTRSAVINFVDDVRIIAGCLTGRKKWDVKPAEKIRGYVLEASLSHLELRVDSIEEDEIRPRFYCREVHAATHAPFRGFNRAQAAVVEAAILVSRLHMLPAEKIDTEIDYLQIAIDKTAGEREKLAWQWLLDAIAEHRQNLQVEVRQ